MSAWCPRRAVSARRGGSCGDAVGRPRASLPKLSCSRPEPSRPGCPCRAPTIRRVRVIRTLDHVRELTARLGDGDSVVVIGSGFIGCEIAASLRRRGQEVSLISDEPSSRTRNVSARGRPSRSIAGSRRKASRVRLGAEVDEIAAGDRIARGAGRAGARGGQGRRDGDRSGAARRAGGGGGPRARGWCRARGRRDAHRAAGLVRRRRRRARRERSRRAPVAGRALGRRARPGRGRGPERRRGRTHSGTPSPGSGRRSATTRSSTRPGETGSSQSRLEQHGGGAFTAWYGRERKIVGVLAHGADEDYERGRDTDRRGGTVALASIVVVPARDEEEQIAGCMAALGAQTVPREQFEVIVVLDACADRTGGCRRERRARALAPALAPRGPRGGRGRGPASGHGRRRGPPARRRGSRTAWSRARMPTPGLLRIGSRDNSRTSGAGARAVAGLIELAPEEARRLPPEVLRRRERDAAHRLERVRRTDPTAAHHHFAGASIGVTAGVYRAVGGLEPLAALEDAAFAERLAQAGIPILRSDDVRVRTSARRHRPGRAGTVGRPRRVVMGGRAALRGKRVPVRAAARSEADDVGGGGDPDERVRGHLGRRPHRHRGPAARGRCGRRGAGRRRAFGRRHRARSGATAGARVIDQDEVLAEYGPALGKGDAMWRALHVCRRRHRLLSRR